MPRVGTVNGVAIYVYGADHNPPHFHAIAAEREARFVIPDLRELVCTLTSPERRMVLEWAPNNMALLRVTWNRLHPHSFVP